MKARGGRFRLLLGLLITGSGLAILIEKLIEQVLR
jgi:hypothetical protein